MVRNLKDLFGIFTREAQRRFVLLASAMMLVSLLETASVAVVFPFIQLALDPSAEGKIISVLVALGVGGQAPPVVVVGWLALMLFLSATFFSALTAWLTFRMGAGENRRLSIRLLRGYVKQPYSFFLGRNTTTLGKNVVAEVDALTNNVLIPLLNLPGRALMVMCIVGFLVYTDPQVAITIVGAVALLYGALYGAIRGPVLELGTRRVAANTNRFMTAQEALGGIKEIKVLGRERFFVNAFRDAAGEYTMVNARNQTLTYVPRYFLEAVAIGGVLGLLLLFIQEGQTNAGIVPLLALYAAAAYRVMPALQQIYASVTFIRFYRELIRMVRDELAVIESGVSQASRDIERNGVGFSQTLELHDVSFLYEGSEILALDGLSMVIRKNSFVGIVGETGSGKTTVIDVLLGLLQSQSGGIRLDGEPLRPEQIRSWQNNIGYVPQVIYLSDSSIRSNIAFGIEEEEIDDDAVIRAAELAGLHRFIVDETSLGYETLVGERGVRLSGGQRQRIGIARALYRNPDVLILDEATSSLDNLTEQAVMNAIRALRGRMTVVVVAHRLSTVQECEQIFVLQKGRVVERGTYQELLSKEGLLAALARDVVKPLQKQRGDGILP